MNGLRSSDVLEGVRPERVPDGRVRDDKGFLSVDAMWSAYVMERLNRPDHER